MTRKCVCECVNRWIEWKENIEKMFHLSIFVHKSYRTKQITIFQEKKTTFHRQPYKNYTDMTIDMIEWVLCKIHDKNHNSKENIRQCLLYNIFVKWNHSKMNQNMNKSMEWQYLIQLQPWNLIGIWINGTQIPADIFLVLQFWREKRNEWQIIVLTSHSFWL